jgi:multidrug resistance protein
MTGELHHHDDIHRQPQNATKATETRNGRKESKVEATEESLSELTLAQSHISTHDIHHVPTNASSFVEVNAAQYEYFSSRRKIVITAILSLCSFLAPISSTTILSAVPEVAETYNTSGSIINVSNALYMIMMGLSPCLWGPLSTLYGRRPICIVTGALFFAFSIGTAAAPNLASYYIFRMLTAYQGTSFLIVGNSCIADIYTPTERGTALSAFLSGTLIGPAFGPFVGGIIVTYRSWRDVFWLQAALGGFATVLVIFFLPETIPYRKIEDISELPRKEKIRKILHWTSPIRVARILLEYPNLLVVGLASSSLVWNMYSLLTPIRYVLNPRFNLSSPIQSGLFYIAPGCGYLLGTFFGGRWSDYIVKKHIKKRGKRVAEDRLHACYFFVGAVIPACMLVYGWSVDQAVGGIPLPVIAMFLQGVAQLFCFPSLNTYCLDVMQAKGLSAEVIAGNYMIRYVFAAAGSALCLPGVQGIGVGWFTSIGCLFMTVTAVGTWVTAVLGEGWRKNVDRKKKERRQERERVEAEKTGGEIGV